MYGSFVLASDVHVPLFSGLLSLIFFTPRHMCLLFTIHSIRSSFLAAFVLSVTMVFT